MRDLLGRLKNVDPHNKLKIQAVYDPYAPALDRLREIVDDDFECSSSEEAVAEHKDVDWVLIGSWNCFHARQAIRALNAGKHVFCEKPLATTLEDCLMIRDAVNRSGKLFSLGLVLRYSKHYAKMDEFLRDGSLGKVISLEFNETLAFNHGGYIFGNWRRLTSNAGTHMLEKCCHDLDLANWLLRSVPLRVASFGGRDYFRPENADRIAEIGPDAMGRKAYQTFEDPERVSPFDGEADIFDNQVAIFHYANGVRASFHTNSHSAIPERRMVFLGTHGTLRADLLTGELEVRRIGWDDHRIKLDTSSRDGHGGGDEIMIQALRETMLHHKAPLASVTEGLCSAVPAFGLDHAAETNQVVELDPLWRKVGIDPETALPQADPNASETKEGRSTVPA